MVDIPTQEVDLLAEWPEAPFPFPMEETSPIPYGPSRPTESPAPRFGIGRRLRSRPRPRSPQRFLPEDPALFGWLSRRFAPGESTLWIGASTAIDGLLEMLYAAIALVRGRVSVLEGANRFHPYRIGEQGRILGIDPVDVLARIRLARAFTAYQLVALADAWASETRRSHPTLLVAHAPSELFLTDEVPEAERAPLLRHVAETLRDLARYTELPLLITCPGGFEHFPGLWEHGPTLFDLLRFTPGTRQLVLDAYRDGAQLALVARVPGQHGLEEFGPTEGREVIAWGARPRRTVKRSKSG